AGRHPNCEIFLDDVTVSRKHAAFVRDGDGFRVRDLGSLNGTYIGKERVDEMRLQYGQDVQSGKYRLTEPPFHGTGCGMAASAGRRPIPPGVRRLSAHAS